MLAGPSSSLDRLARRPRYAAAVLLWLGALTGCAAGARTPAGPYPQFAEFSGRKVVAVRFTGDLKLPSDSLLTAITTQASGCKTPLIRLCPFGVGRVRYNLDLPTLARDATRIRLVYRDAGYYGTRVTPVVDPVQKDNAVRVSFAIEPGDRISTSAIEIAGMEGVADTARLKRRLPLKVGEPFGRAAFLASADTLRNTLLQRGYAYAQVLRNYAIDTVADVATARYEAARGPEVTVDSILFVGMDRLTEKIARRQLTFRQGNLLRASDLNQSQRNLFDLELVSFASVEIAPDSLQISPDSLALMPDSIGTTVLVRVVEAPKYLAEVFAGFATQDCFRARGSNVDRNFLGGARRFEISGSISKLGAGSPLNLSNQIFCRAPRPDSLRTQIDTLNERFATALNYRLAADFLQPRLFGTRTSVTAGAYTERTSEIELYLRAATGARLGVIRRITPRTVLTTGLNAERGYTQATDVLFCRAFEVCQSEVADVLRRPRWSNVASASVVHDRTRGAPGPTRGYQLRGGIDWATQLLASDDRFLRLFTEGAVYRPVRRDWTLSGRLLLGTFLTGLAMEENGFIPPNRRFYAGGANSVRGYGRNQLGPVVYIQVPHSDTTDARADTLGPFPTGGTRTVVSSVELTMPSPFLRRYLRVAGFVDAGQVWQSADTVVARPGLRITPGMGIRFATPVGPLRLDAAYNPYGFERGPLYAADENGRLNSAPIDLDYVKPGGRSFLSRFTLQIAVGNAF